VETTQEEGEDDRGAEGGVGEEDLIRTIVDRTILQIRRVIEDLVQTATIREARMIQSDSLK